MTGPRPPSPVLRLLRWWWPGTNPLARRTDRVEGAVATMAVLLVLALLPVMLVLGSLTYDDLATRHDEMVRTRHRTTATLLQDVPVEAVTAYGTGAAAVPARWDVPDGAVRTGPVRAAGGLRAGATVEIWVDESGSVVSAPPRAEDAVVVATVVALSGWLTVAGLLALVQFGLHNALRKRRLRDWEQEWRQVDRDWHGRRV